MAESDEELKNLLVRVKEESEKVSLKLNIQKTKIMVSGPITSWQIDGETVETVADYFWGLQNHCRLWLQPWKVVGGIRMGNTCISMADSCQCMTKTTKKKIFFKWKKRKEKTLAPWKKSYDQPRQHIKKQRHYFANKSPSSQGYGFSNSHIWMWELDYKESWVPKNWCFWTWCWRRLLTIPWTARRSIHPS